MRERIIVYIEKAEMERKAGEQRGRDKREKERKRDNGVVTGGTT
jgi:hypothetical protein